MTVKSSIRRRYDMILRKRERLDAELKELRAACPHDGARKEARSDTGNWCRADDRYWHDCECPHCGLRWTEEQ